MKIVILGGSDHKEFLTGTDDVEIVWIEKLTEFSGTADALIVFDSELSGQLQDVKASVILINSVTDKLDQRFVRFNGWAGFLSGDIIEAAGAENLQSLAGAVVEKLNRRILWLPDEAGFVSARVVSMMINEAYLLLEEGGSSRADIDLAMRLGTNYPFGPFEWADKIGIKNIVMLLTALSKDQPHYRPCRLLEQAARKD